jgi:hypothetical protein
MVAGTVKFEGGTGTEQQVEVAAPIVLHLLSGLCAAMERLRFRQQVSNDIQDQFASDDAGSSESADTTALAAPTARNKKGSRFVRRSTNSTTATDGSTLTSRSTNSDVPGSNTGCDKEESNKNDDVATLASTPPFSLPAEHWGDADVSAFIVRGPSFTEDRVKIPAGEPLFDLVAVDLWRLNEGPCPNIAAQPGNRVQLARQRGDKTWTFVLQFQVPGPPWFAFVAYYVPRDVTNWSLNRKGSSGGQQDAPETPFDRLAKPFFFGDDDDYRDDHFKLIPKVVEGNFIVRNAVGAKPTILGRKLKQHYFRGENYFELDVDIASSAIAQRVVGIAYGYAKLLTVDLCCVLQGDSVDELPEQPFAAVRMVGIDFNTAPVHPPLVFPVPSAAAGGVANGVEEQKS